MINDNNQPLLIDGVSSELLEGLTPEQQDVLKRDSQNLLVNAGAGSGKTTVLTKRVIHLLKDKNYSLDEMIVLTFTDLAAKQMKDKIIKALKNETNPKLKEELTHIDEANIMTFDAFCHKLLEKYNMYSTIGSPFSIGDKALFNMIKRQDLEQIVNFSGFYDDPKTSEFIESMGYDNPDDFINFLSNLYDQIDYELDPDYVIDQYFDHHYDPKFYNMVLDNLETVIRFLVGNVKKYPIYYFNNRTEKYARGVENYLDDITNSSDMEEIFINIKKGFPDLGKAKTTDIEDDADLELFNKTKKEATDAIKRFTGLLSGFNTYEEFKDNYFKYTNFELKCLFFIKNARIGLESFKRMHNIYTFQDIALECIRILKNHPEICDYYKKNIKEILIDEYQDTNDINSELIALISNNNEVVVGDVKQSIYRFRNANPDLFQNRYNRYKQKVGGEKIDLLKNFRSRDDEVIQIVNDIFYHLHNDTTLDSDFFDKKMDQGYEDYKKCNNPLNKFKIIEYDPKDERYTEADYIAQDILNRMAAGQTVYDPDLKKERNAEFGDFLILSYAGTKFYDYKKTLEKYGIPVNVSDDTKYTDSYEVVFIKNALKLVRILDVVNVDPKVIDQTLISLLRSYVLGVSDSMVLKYMALKADKKYTSLEAFSMTFPDLYSTFNELVNVYRDFGIAKLMDEIILRFNVYKQLTRLDDQEAREAKLSVIVSNIETYAKSGLGLDSIINYFDYLKTAKDDSKAKINQLADLSCVQMMTIHKSKGLENYIVYVANLRSQLSKKQEPYSKKYGVNLKHTDNIKSILTKYEEKREKNKEFFRLLYVALTRARESLTLMFEIDKRETDKDVYNFTNLQEFLLYNHHFKDSDYTTVEIKNSKATKNPVDTSKSKDIEYVPLNLKEKELIVRTHASHDAVVVDEEINRSLERGTLLHSFFEITDFLTADIDEELERKCIADEYKKYLKKFYYQPIFSGKTIRELHEFPYYKDNSSGSIDYVLEKEDELIIVDFKTSRIDDPAYVDQLRTYKEFMATRINKPIKTYLYSMMKNELKEIET